MQVGRIRELFTNLSSLSEFSERKRSKFFPTIVQNKDFVDSISISDIAQRLNFKLQNASSIRRAELMDSLPPVAKKVDSAMKQAVSILEHISDLTELAQDESLGDDVRVEIQIEIEDLRANLETLPSSILNGGTVAPVHDQMNDIYNSFAIGDWGDGSSLLERMRARISNGEEWNVREAYSALGSIDSSDNLQGSGWYVVDDNISVITQDKNGKLTSTGANVPTVKERLEAGTPYAVMDAKSAHRSMILIEQQIERIQQWREDLPMNVSQIGDIEVEASLFLDDVISPGQFSGGRTLNDPDIALCFMYYGKIYDSPFAAYASGYSDAEGNDVFSIRMDSYF